MTEPTDTRRAAIAALGLGYAIAAIQLVPDGLVWVMTLPGAGSTNKLFVPLGYWAVSLLYAWLVWRLIGGRARSAIVPALRTAVGVQVLLLLRSVVQTLGDGDAFASGVYRRYTESVIWTAVVLSTAWTVRTMWLLRARRDSALLEVPLCLAAVVLAVTYGAHSPVLALAALGAGVAAGAWRASVTSPSQWVPPAARRLMSSDVVWLLIIFVVAFALRVAFALQVMTNPRYVETGPDGPTYDALGWSMAQGHGVPQEFADSKKLMLLGYVRFVAVVYEAAGRNYFVVCVIQALLGAVACVLVYLIAKSIFGVAAARIAAIFSAVSFLLIFSAAALAHQAVDVFLMALMVWMLLRYVKRRDPGWLEAAAVGVVLGAAVANRETVACVWVFLLVWLPWALADRVGWRGAAGRTAVLTIAMFALLAPLLVQIVGSAEDRALARSHLDYLFLASARSDIVAPFADPAAAAQQLGARPTFVIGTFLNSVWTNFAIQFLQQDAGGFDLVFLRRGSVFYYVMFANALAFAIAGLVIAIRRAWRGGPEAMAIALILGLIGSRTAIHLALNSTYLHRAPIEPYLIMLASLTAAALLGADESPA